jgi:hypothetical protein
MARDPLRIDLVRPTRDCCCLTPNNVMPCVWPRLCPTVHALIACEFVCGQVFTTHSLCALSLFCVALFFYCQTRWIPMLTNARRRLEVVAGRLSPGAARLPILYALPGGSHIAHRHRPLHTSLFGLSGFCNVASSPERAGMPCGRAFSCLAFGITLSVSAPVCLDAFDVVTHRCNHFLMHSPWPCVYTCVPCVACAHIPQPPSQDNSWVRPGKPHESDTSTTGHRRRR